MTRLGKIMSAAVLPAIIASCSWAGPNYWNLSTDDHSPTSVTYPTLDDMLLNTHYSIPRRLDPYIGGTVVASGSDGTTYWNIFSDGTWTDSITYATLDDMLLNVSYDFHGVLAPYSAGGNIVASGSD
ncbi:MAG: hypothetical protein ACYS8Z_10025, partial [Planctomycetota bacterium]